MIINEGQLCSFLFVGNVFGFLGVFKPCQKVHFCRTCVKNSFWARCMTWMVPARPGHKTAQLSEILQLVSIFLHDVNMTAEIQNKWSNHSCCSLPPGSIYSGCAGHRPAVHKSSAGTLPSEKNPLRKVTVKTIFSEEGRLLMALISFDETFNKILVNLFSCVRNNILNTAAAQQHHFPQTHTHTHIWKEKRSINPTSLTSTQCENVPICQFRLHLQLSVHSNCAVCLWSDGQSEFISFLQIRRGLSPVSVIV